MKSAASPRLSPVRCARPNAVTPYEVAKFIIFATARCSLVTLLSGTPYTLDAALAWIDDRADYGEARIVALAPIGDRLFFVAFVDRSDSRRNISLRRANRCEVNHYVRAIQKDLVEDANT